MDAGRCCCFMYKIFAKSLIESAASFGYHAMLNNFLREKFSNFMKIEG